MTKRQFVKRKERERRVRQKMLRRRAAIDRAERESKDRLAWEKRVESESGVAQVPYRRSDDEDPLTYNERELSRMLEEYDRNKTPALSPPK